MPETFRKMGQKQGVPPFGPFLTLFWQKGCKFGTQGSQGRWSHALPVPPEPLPRPPEALFCSPEPQLTLIMPWESAGVALGAQVGHVASCIGSPGGYLIYTLFAKTCQKRSKRGYPLFLTHFREGFRHRGTPPTRMAPRMAQTPPLGHPEGAFGPL